MAANEDGNGAPNGRTAPIHEDELRRDETRIVARGHRDAAELYGLLIRRTETVAQLVEDFGSGDCVAVRKALERFTEYSLRLIPAQFADLKGTP